MRDHYDFTGGVRGKYATRGAVKPEQAVSSSCGDSPHEDPASPAPGTAGPGSSGRGR